MLIFTLHEKTSQMDVGIQLIHEDACKCRSWNECRIKYVEIHRSKITNPRSRIPICLIGSIEEEK